MNLVLKINSNRHFALCINTEKSIVHLVTSESRLTKNQSRHMTPHFDCTLHLAHGARRPVVLILKQTIAEITRWKASTLTEKSWKHDVCSFLFDSTSNWLIDHSISSVEAVNWRQLPKVERNLAHSSQRVFQARQWSAKCLLTPIVSPSEE